MQKQAERRINMKYILTDNEKAYNGTILRQLKQESGLEAMSGYIENIDSLKSDDCSIGNDVLILGNPTLKGEICLGDDTSQSPLYMFSRPSDFSTIIADNAEISDCTICSEFKDSKVFGDAKISDSHLKDCAICGKAIVHGSELEDTSALDGAIIKKCCMQNSQISGNANLEKVYAISCVISDDVKIKDAHLSQAYIVKQSDLIVYKNILNDDKNKIDLYVYRAKNCQSLNWTNDTILAHVYQEKFNQWTEETEILSVEDAIGIITENGVEESYNANMYNVSGICEPETKELFVDLVKKAMKSLLESY